MALELRHIYKNFGDHNVLTNLSLFFPENRVTAIMGPSGSGKTTIINIIAGLQTPDHGEIAGLRGHKFSMVFQEDRLLEHRSGLNNVLYVLPRPKAHETRALELLNQAGLAQDVYKRARDYSGGMKRRLALCRALAADFSLLILDEPFKGLDAALKPKIMAMVKTRAAEKTVILVTHDKEEAAFFGSRIIDITNPPNICH
ncbi:MAG: ATP-binding cassette domain-containing protein [Defluviitaleaceae bacterium]|nr:ATP-binding cassette domain-containing protein [Defluviitaleaceae bacterium]